MTNGIKNLKIFSPLSQGRPQRALASGAPLLRKCLPTQIHVQVLSGSSSSTARRLESLLIPEAYFTGGTSYQSLLQLACYIRVSMSIEQSRKGLAMRKTSMTNFQIESLIITHLNSERTLNFSSYAERQLSNNQQLKDSNQQCHFNLQIISAARHNSHKCCLFSGLISCSL